MDGNIVLGIVVVIVFLAMVSEEKDFFAREGFGFFEQSLDKAGFVTKEVATDGKEVIDTFLGGMRGVFCKTGEDTDIFGIDLMKPSRM